MPTRILIKNIANAWLTGDVIGVFGGEHVFGALESKERFIDSGESPDDWPRQFVIVNITDADKEDYEYLLESKKGPKEVMEYYELEHNPYEIDDEEASLLDEEELRLNEENYQKYYEENKVLTKEEVATSGGRRYYIQPQGEDSPFYDQLLEHAEVTVTKSILDTLIVERL